MNSMYPKLYYRDYTQPQCSLCGHGLPDFIDFNAKMCACVSKCKQHQNHVFPGPGSTYTVRNLRLTWAGTVPWIKMNILHFSQFTLS